MRRAFLRSRLTTVKIIIIAAVIAVATIIGYRFYNEYQDKKAMESAETSGVSVAPAITTVDGLDKASEAIDEIQLESSNEMDLSELDSELDEF